MNYDQVYDASWEDESEEEDGIIYIPHRGYDVNLLFVRLTEKATPLSPPANPGDLGIDLFSSEDVVIRPHEMYAVSTGIAVAFPYNYGAILRPRSRDNFLIGSGVIDAGYRGEIFVKVVNFTHDFMAFRIGDSLGQMILQPVLSIKTAEILKMPVDTERGTSSGHERNS